MDCIFCKIIAKEIPSEILYEDDEIIAFPDISPSAPVHLLIITKKHIPSLAHMEKADIGLIGRMTEVANTLARQKEILEKGYRIVINSGKDGGQVVPHLHMHLLGGAELKWIC
jgi:histidine triad (HIT) family protein